MWLIGTFMMVTLSSVRALDLAGKVFGRLTVLSRAGVSDDRKITWLCRCECGNEVVRVGTSIKKGNVRSCGCLRNETTSARAKLATKHGMCRSGARSPEWCAWQSMVSRCENPNIKAYPRYGGRGIVVHGPWHDFETFLAYVGHRPSDVHSLDRYPNPDGNYEPGNVRWATVEEQNRNKTCAKLTQEKVDSMRRLAADGVNKTDIAAEFGVSRATVRDVVSRRTWRTRAA